MATTDPSPAKVRPWDKRATKAAKVGTPGSKKAAEVGSSGSKKTAISSESEEDFQESQAMGNSSDEFSYCE